MDDDTPTPPASPPANVDRRTDAPDQRLVKVERRTVPHQKLLAEGQRAFTIEQVAHALHFDVRTIRKLIAIQRAEDAEALRDGREPNRLGLRARRMTVRGTRISEAEFDEYLKTLPPPSRQ